MAENNDWTNRIKRFITSDSRTFYWLLVIFASIPLIHPIGLPINISTQTQLTYDHINSLPEGSLVLFSPGIPVAYSEIYASQLAVMKDLMRNNLKVVIFASSADALITLNQILDGIDLKNKVYGVDYVNLGLIAGGESAIAALATSFKETVVADINGTPSKDLDILKDITGAKNFSLIVHGDSGQYYMYFIRHWYKPFQVPQVLICTAAVAAAAQPYYNSKDIQFMVITQKGGAEYEKLINEPASSLKLLDSLSISLIYVVGLIIAGNISRLIPKLRKGDV